MFDCQKFFSGTLLINPIYAVGNSFIKNNGENGESFSVAIDPKYILENLVENDNTGIVFVLKEGSASISEVLGKINKFAITTKAQNVVVSYYN